MIFFNYLSNLRMGGGGPSAAVVSYVDPGIGSLVTDAAIPGAPGSVDPEIGSLVTDADAPLFVEIDPEIGSLVIA